jgi:hypothetical protein
MSWMFISGHATTVLELILNLMYQHRLCQYSSCSFFDLPLRSFMSMIDVKYMDTSQPPDVDLLTAGIEDVESKVLMSNGYGTLIYKN